MSSSTVPRKMFSTPVKPVTQERFASVREKVVRESPYLYKSKILSSPVKDAKRVSRSVGGTPLARPAAFQKPRPSGLDHTPSEAEAKGTVAAGNSESVLGEFENPVLAQYSRRIVNKELETRKIISNLFAVLVWNLALKFLSLYLDHTLHGAGFSKRAAKWIQETLVYRINPYADFEHSRWARLLTLANISHIFHLAVFYNVTVSLWRLLVKSQNVKIDDLHLNQRQKQLLGLSDQPQTSNNLPRVMLAAGSQETLSNQTSLATSPRKNPAQPVFLFKSLQTPLKSKERAAAAERAGVMSERAPKINAFGDLRTSVLQKSSLTPSHVSSGSLPTAMNRTGYIPSSKYAYMRDSPSPRKSM
ncbi:LAQU0S05e00628g1_1 [Lachancea quebecensis]|uniref:LAQU0S05e00628g1_1 n=1 Tax=Lachancea quebecensis TaxID=1654605 RepID=A0A0N7MLG6_9SACH|nr:LAQU0S05e00628g1_1 [Lachancea quebecensis]